MYLRSTTRKKDGKLHRYFSVVESRRLSAGHMAQRTVLYLGEINDKQEASWRKSLSVFDQDRQQYTTMSLFPDDRVVPEDAVNGIQVRLGELELRNPRVFGNCWLACELWQQLGLDQFWQERLPEGREAIGWDKVLELLVTNRLIEPGSEFRLHRHWFLSSAMDELLNTDFIVAEKDRLYRCLDRVLAHKRDLFLFLRQKWADLFAADFEVLLYDLTSTYFEDEMKQNPKAKRGYSRDGRPDCLQVVIALVVTTDGFPPAYEVMDALQCSQSEERNARSCRFSVSDKRTKVSRTSPASPPWREMASMKVVEFPSCINRLRVRTPHNGAVRILFRVAGPPFWTIPSPVPISWIKKSTNGRM